MVGWGNRGKVKKGIGWQIKSGKTGAAADSQKISAFLWRALKTSAMPSPNIQSLKLPSNLGWIALNSGYFAQLPSNVSWKDAEYPTPHLSGWRSNIYQWIWICFLVLQIEKGIHDVALWQSTWRALRLFVKILYFYWFVFGNKLKAGSGSPDLQTIVDCCKIDNWESTDDFQPKTTAIKK